MKDFIKAGTASVIVGGQFGSEAKGLAASYVAIKSNYEGMLICTTNAGAQAGHTTVLDDGAKFVCYHLPTIGVLRPHSLMYLNAGSIIDPDLLLREMHDICEVTGEDLGHMARRLYVHPNAAVVTKEAKEIEASGATTHLGSTQKGVGAALANKIMRKPGSIMKSYKDEMWPGVTVEKLYLMDTLSEGGAVTVEIPQGTGLSINATDFFPKCTSRDCWLLAGLTDAAIHPKFLGNVLMVVRTFPIRVGHIYDKDGDKIGDSGPFYPDCKELDWATHFPGVEPERTTVTKRVRRIAQWSWQQYQDALELNRPTHVLLTFANYFSRPEDLNAHVLEMGELAQEVLGYTPAMLVSDAPNTGSVIQWLV